jgi:sterol desaturase/sphingolipid hydroxylase (fatty acid hydroxylase superfamily)
MTYRTFIGSTAGFMACLVVAVLGAWLLWSHTGHILAAIPFLFLVACPLMHFMHRGHHHRASAPPTTDTSTTTKT